jgi:hypothetical protein
MKLILRKVKSNKIGEDYTLDLFTPLTIQNKKFAISMTMNEFSLQSYNIEKKYDLSTANIRSEIWKNYIKRAVYEVYAYKHCLLVPSTYDSNKSTIAKYTNQLLVKLSEYEYVHFTHFGFLKDKFPKNQIQQILDIFFDKFNLIQTEICWDIDEKFFNEMHLLLTKYYDKHMIKDNFLVVNDVDC